MCCCRARRAAQPSFPPTPRELQPIARGWMRSVQPRVIPSHLTGRASESASHRPAPRANPSEAPLTHRLQRSPPHVTSTQGSSPSEQPWAERHNAIGVKSDVSVYRTHKRNCASSHHPPTPTALNMSAQDSTRSVAPWAPSPHTPAEPTPRHQPAASRGRIRPAPASDVTPLE